MKIKNSILSKMLEPCKEITKSKINSKYKKLKDIDVELLNKLLNRFENDEVLVVLKNEKYYSKSTVESYKVILDSIRRIHDMIEVGTDNMPKMLPKDW